MKKLFLLRDFDQKEFYEEADYLDEYKDILCESPLGYVDSFFTKNSNPTIEYLPRLNPLINYELTLDLQKKQALKQQIEGLNQFCNQSQPYLCQKDNRLDPSINKYIEQGQTSQQQPKSRRRQGEKTQKIRKYDKNQYDKNIPGNIVLTVANYILLPNYKLEIQFYCRELKIQSQVFDVDYAKVVEFATNVKVRTHKFGTSQLGSFFLNKKEKSGLEKVFGLFMVRFLKEQYTLHILRVGKMSNKYKYLECATNMMYIPRLRQEEYALIHQFRRKTA